MESKTRFYLRRRKLNAGGYDSTGQYWGVGAPLWDYETRDGAVCGQLRADDRAHAKERVNALLDKQMAKWDVYWSPEGRRIAESVPAATPEEAKRKAPMPYRKYLGEMYAVPAQ